MYCWSDSHPWRASTRQHQVITLHRLEVGCQGRRLPDKSLRAHLQPSFTGHSLTPSSKQCTSIRWDKDSKGCVLLLDTLPALLILSLGFECFILEAVRTFVGSSFSSIGLLTIHTWASIIYYYHHQKQQCKTNLHVLQIHTFLKSQHVLPSHRSNGIKRNTGGYPC